MSFKNPISASIYRISKQDPFIGGLLQELNFKFSEEIPTACLRYFKDNGSFDVIINEKFFDKLTPQEKDAVLTHEIMHFTHKHTYRFLSLGLQPDPDNTSKFYNQKQTYNIAADMAINQYIIGLPKDAVDIKDWKKNDKTPFPTLQTMETYYQLIQDNKQANKEITAKYSPMDEHYWEDLTEDEQKELLKNVKGVVERTMEKTRYGFNRLPEHIRDLLKSIHVTIDKLNYKQILKQAIRKHLTGHDRKHTWLRPSKRYGNYAPGRTNDNLPKLSVYIDTSGSISHSELNEFLTVMNTFLKVGSKSCDLYLWHDNIYFHKKHKLNKTFEDSLQGGGTDVTGALQNIIDTKPDLAIILTDGYFGKCVLQPSTEVIWVISKNGQIDHPNNEIGRTIPLKELK
jgi:predicted metal-dependent peptidase